MQETTTDHRAPAVRIRQDNLHFMSFWTGDQGLSNIEAAAALVRDRRHSVAADKQEFSDFVSEVFASPAEGDERVALMERGQQLHERANESLALMADAVQILRHYLQAQAREANLAYPQYDGSFDEWVVCLVTEQVSARGDGVVLGEPGHLVLAEPTPKRLFSGDPLTRSFRDASTGRTIQADAKHLVPLPTK